MTHVTSQVLFIARNGQKYPRKGSNESIDKFVVWLKETYGGYNVLVNNAGIASELNQDDQPHIEKLVETVNTNFSGTAYVSQVFNIL